MESSDAQPHPNYIPPPGVVKTFAIGAASVLSVVTMQIVLDRVDKERRRRRNKKLTFGFGK